MRWNIVVHETSFGGLLKIRPWKRLANLTCSSMSVRQNLDPKIYYGICFLQIISEVEFLSLNLLQHQPRALTMELAWWPMALVIFLKKKSHWWKSQDHFTSLYTRAWGPKGPRNQVTKGVWIMQMLHGVGMQWTMFYSLWYFALSPFQRGGFNIN